MSELITSWAPLEYIKDPSTAHVMKCITSLDNPELKVLGGVSLTYCKSNSKGELIEDHRLDFWSEGKEWFVLRGNWLHILQADSSISGEEIMKLGTYEADELKLPKKFLISLSEVEQVVSEFLDSGGIKLSDRWKLISPYY